MNLAKNIKVDHFLHDIWSLSEEKFTILVSIRKIFNSIEFSNGVELSDPNNILEGKGKKRRHIKIYSVKCIDEKKVDYSVRQVLSKTNR